MKSIKAFMNLVDSYGVGVCEPYKTKDATYKVFIKKFPTSKKRLYKNFISTLIEEGYQFYIGVYGKEMYFELPLSQF